MNAGDSVPFAEVIGDPIAQSKSPAIHRFWLERAGIVGDYRARHVTAGALADYLALRRGDVAWRGCNVTMPHKQTVMPLLDRVDAQAARIGAVNTICREADGALVGYNTDAAGFLEPLLPLLAQQQLFRMARVFGTGGAARAIVAALADAGFVIVLIGRDPGKARALLDAIDPDGEHHVAALADFAEPTDFAFDDRAMCLDLVINASPLGMTGQPPLTLDFSHVPPGSHCYDIVTAPPDTPFLQAARARGLPVIDGLAMLIGQAAAAFERFFGVPPPRREDAALRNLLTHDHMTAPGRPFILGLTGSIGMGKSTVAAMFADCGVPVFDADREVHRLQGAGGALVPAIEAAFPGTTGPAGVERLLLGQQVFGDSAALARLEAIVHPAVAARRAGFLAAQADAPLVVFDIPLLYEKTGAAGLDAVAVVSAAPAIQRERVMARPGMTEEKFAQILALQVPDEEKRARADHVIDTGTSLAATRAAVERLIQQLSAAPGG